MKNNEEVNNSPNKKQPTISEMKEFYEKNKKRLEKFDKSMDALKRLRNENKNTKLRTINNYSKESVKTYIKNVSSNEANLRNLSRYLFYRSEIYYRLCKYYANQIDTSIHSVIPNYSLVEDNDKDSILQSYEATLNVLDDMHIQYEVFKSAVVNMREDVFYACSYYTEGEGMFWLPLDADYCKINGVFTDGSYSFAMDMSYFRKNADLLEYYGEPFTSLYKAYESSGDKYQQMPEEYAVCTKFRSEDWETIVPPFTPIFLSLIDLMDMADYQAVQEAANIYKLVWLEMKTMGNDEPDNWSVDPEIMIEYFNKMINDAIPDYISAAIVPGELHEISFPDSGADSDVTKVEKATKEILNSAGGAQILNLNSASNSTAFKYGVAADTEFIMSPIIPQIEAIINRLLRFYVGEDHCKVKFFEVGIFQKEDFRKSLLESAQYGLPTKLMVNSLNGFSEKETMALNFLEEDILSVSTKFRPLSSSYTQSGDGSNTKDESDLTDAGLRTRDEDLNNK